VYVRAPAARVAADLLRGYRLHENIEVPVMQRDEFAFEARPPGAAADTARGAWLQIWLQPMSTTETTVHGTMHAAAETPIHAAQTPIHAAQMAIHATERLRWLRHHNLQLTSLRDASERVGR
jgi:hypothetical protein